jgi:hypothetical protein
VAVPRHLPAPVVVEHGVLERFGVESVQLGVVERAAPLIGDVA